MRGALRKLFCTEQNFGPEDAFKGRVIVLNLPVKEYNELGQFAQVLFKFVFQRAVERRIAGVDRKTAEKTTRPVFVWADESQFFVNSYDALFQSTARASDSGTGRGESSKPEWSMSSSRTYSSQRLRSGSVAQNLVCRA